MRNKVISINLIDKTIVVDGEGYRCPDMPDVSANTRAIQWNPHVGKFAGVIEHGSESTGFREFETVERFLPAWRAAQAVEEKLEAERKAKREAEEAAEVAAEEASAASAKLAEQNRPRDEALGFLYSTDYKILRAMEAKLVADGLLDADLAQQRQKARETVKKSTA